MGQGDVMQQRSTKQLCEALGGESYVANSMPQYCVAYYGNGLVQASAPIYVEEPMQGGHWVERKTIHKPCGPTTCGQAAACGRCRN
jgi:hypothetical protein